MPTELFQLRWGVAEQGYEWRDVSLRGHPLPEGARPVRLLVARGDADDIEMSARWYDPFVDALALFRTFADLAPTQEAIYKFANHYGWLHYSPPFVADPGAFQIHAPGSDDHARVVWGESLEQWIEAIGQVRYAVALWDRLQMNDREDLARYLRQEGLEQSFEREAGRRTGPVWTGHAALYTMVAAQLTNTLSAQPVWDADRQRLSLALVPANLFAALWLQFVNSVQGNIEYQKCAWCGKWFAIVPPQVRSSRAYCSTACRSKAYRKRQADARKLAATGVSLEEIASRLETTVETARGWIERQHRA